MMKKLWIRRLCAAAACAAMLIPAQAEEAPELLEPAGVRLSSAEVRRGDMQKISAYDGAVIPHVEEMYFEVDGAIDEVLAVVGQPVKKGDVLLTLDRENQDERCKYLEEEIAALETDMGFASAIAAIDLEILGMELERLGGQSPRDDRAIALKKLEIEKFELNVSMQAELAQLKLGRLRSELESIRSESLKAELTAPFDGRVMFIAGLRPGSRVSAYAPLVYLADDSRLCVEAEYISETNLDRAHELYALIDGMRVELIPQPVDKSEILSKAVSGEAMTTRYDLPVDAEVSAGQYAAVCLVDGYHEDTLIVPANTIYSGAGGRYVYVVEDGVRIRRDVKVGMYNSCDAQILEGLEEGEKVYVPD